MSLSPLCCGPCVGHFIRRLYFQLSLFELSALALALAPVRTSSGVLATPIDADYLQLRAETQGDIRDAATSTDAKSTLDDLYYKYPASRLQSHINSCCHNPKAFPTQHFIYFLICFSISLTLLLSFPPFDCILMYMERSKIVRFVLRFLTYLGVSPVIHYSVYYIWWKDVVR